jgi:hypothetical protein
VQLPDSWWADLTKTLEKASATVTDRIAVRQQYIDRTIPEFVGIPAPAVTCWTTAHADLQWANLTAPLRILDREGWGQAPEEFDAALLYAYTLLQEAVATRVRDREPRGQPHPRRPAPGLVRGTSPPLSPPHLTCRTRRLAQPDHGRSACWCTSLKARGRGAPRGRRPGGRLPRPLPHRGLLRRYGRRLPLVASPVSPRAARALSTDSCSAAIRSTR